MKFRKPRRWVNRVFIHCSAASRSTIDAAEIDCWHKQRGWSGIGYHYFIKTDGTLEKGRPINKVPAAQRGHNSGSIAICLNGLDESDFTQTQLDIGVVVILGAAFALYARWDDAGRPDLKEMFA